MVRTAIATAALTLGVALAIPAATPAFAKPGGCLKYGAVGAVAGHAAGHTFKGAVAGCALGIYERHKYKKQMRDQGAPAPAGTTGQPPGKSI